jgi:hypothetical protein
MNMNIEYEITRADISANDVLPTGSECNALVVTVISKTDAESHLIFVVAFDDINHNLSTSGLVASSMWLSLSNIWDQTIHNADMLVALEQDTGMYDAWVWGMYNADQAVIDLEPGEFPNEDAETQLNMTILGEDWAAVWATWVELSVSPIFTRDQAAVYVEELQEVEIETILPEDLICPICRLPFGVTDEEGVSF